MPEPFEIRDDLKRKMEEYADRVNWSEELERCIEEKIEDVKALEEFEKVMEKVEVWSRYEKRKSKKEEKLRGLP